MQPLGETNPVASSVRGRGAATNPGNRFDAVHLHVLDEERQRRLEEHPDGVQITTEAHADATRSIINPVNSPDLAFKWTINPYRGCEHGCIYCYARPTHENLGYSCGIDFETRIVAKTDAPQLLRRELLSPAWRGEGIVMSGVTDAYQPIERKLRITRACLEIMAACAQPVSIITKNHLVTRDIDLLKSLAQRSAASVAISVTTLDPKLARVMEPRASSPADRLRAIEELCKAGVPVMAMTSPIIPAINDRELPQLLKAVADAGAMTAGWTMLRLPWQVKTLFAEWLNRHMPDRASHVISAIEDVRDGRLNDPNFGVRMRGSGPRAEQIAQLFRVYKRRFGLDRKVPPLSSASFDPAPLDDQMRLFRP